MQKYSTLYQDFSNRVTAEQLSELKNIWINLKEKGVSSIPVLDFISCFTSNSKKCTQFQDDNITNIIQLCQDSKDSILVENIEEMINQLDSDILERKSEPDSPFFHIDKRFVQKGDQVKSKISINNTVRKHNENALYNADNEPNALVDKIMTYLKKVKEIFGDLSIEFDSDSQNLEKNLSSQNRNKDSVNFCYKTISNILKDFKEHVNIFDECRMKIKKFEDEKKHYYVQYLESQENKELLQEWINRIEHENERQFNTINNLEQKLVEYDTIKQDLNFKDQEVDMLKQTIERNASIKDTEVYNLLSELNRKRDSIVYLEDKTKKLEVVYDLYKKDEFENLEEKNALKNKQEILELALEKRVEEKDNLLHQNKILLKQNENNIEAINNEVVMHADIVNENQQILSRIIALEENGHKNREVVQPSGKNTLNVPGLKIHSKHLLGYSLASNPVQANMTDIELKSTIQSRIESGVNENFDFFTDIEGSISDAEEMQPLSPKSAENIQNPAGFSKRFIKSSTKDKKLALDLHFPSNQITDFQQRTERENTKNFTKKLVNTYPIKVFIEDSIEISDKKPNEFDNYKTCDTKTKTPKGNPEEKTETNNPEEKTETNNPKTEILTKDEEKIDKTEELLINYQEKKYTVRFRGVDIDITVDTKLPELDPKLKVAYPNEEEYQKNKKGIECEILKKNNLYEEIEKKFNKQSQETRLENQHINEELSNLFTFCKSLNDEISNMFCSRTEIQDRIIKLKSEKEEIIKKINGKKYMKLAVCESIIESLNNKQKKEKLTAIEERAILKDIQELKKSLSFIKNIDIIDEKIRKLSEEMAEMFKKNNNKFLEKNNIKKEIESLKNSLKLGTNISSNNITSDKIFVTDQKKSRQDIRDLKNKKIRLKDDFDSAKSGYYAYQQDQRAIHTMKKIQVMQLNIKKDKEIEQERIKNPELFVKVTKYQNQIDICENLISYLSSLIKTSQKLTNDIKHQTITESSKATNLRRTSFYNEEQVLENLNNFGYENLKIHKGKNEADESLNSKRKRTARNSVKRSQLFSNIAQNSGQNIIQHLPKSFSLSADVINMFVEVDCKPPLKDIDIESCLKEVSEKKEFYIKIPEIKNDDENEQNIDKNESEKMLIKIHNRNLSLDDYTMFPEFK